MPVTPRPPSEGVITLQPRVPIGGVSMVTLSHDFEWVDEASWSKVVQDVAYATSGNVFVQQGVRLSGRYITLQGKDDMAWIERHDLDLLMTLIDARKEMTLTMTYDYLPPYPGSRTFNVIFRYHEQPIDYRSVLGFQSQKGYGKANGADNWFILSTLRLMEVPIGSMIN